MTFRINQDEIEEQLDKQRALDEMYVGYDGNDDEFFIKYPPRRNQMGTGNIGNDMNGGYFDEEGGEDDEDKNFLAVKPWVGTLYPPSKYRIPVPNGTKGEYMPVFTDENNNWAAPEIDLELDYAFGYRARDCRNNIHQVDNTHVLYHCAGIGVIKDLKTEDEDFFFGHTGDILCLDYHEATGLVCTGSSGANYEAQLCVWDSKPPQRCLHNIKGFHRYAVVSCAFNPQGTMVLSIGLDEHHSVALHCTVTGLLLACSQSDKSRVVYGRFMQCLRSKSETTFVTVGTKHIKFWGPTEESDKMTSFFDPEFVDVEKKPASASEEKNYQPNTYMVSQLPEESRLVSISGSKCKEINNICLLSIEFTRTHVLVGASNGHVYAFHAATKECEASFFITSERILSLALIGENVGPRDGSAAYAVGTGCGMLYFYRAEYQAGEGGAKSLHFNLDKTMGGGKGMINVNLFNEATRNMVTETNSNPSGGGGASESNENNRYTAYPASIRALNYNTTSGKLLVGTILNHIYKLDPKLAHQTTPQVIVNGHWGRLDDPCGYGELWGIDASPNSHHIATACDDGMIRKWELVDSKEVGHVYVGQPAVSVSWSLDDKYIAAALEDGSFVVYTSDLSKLVFRSPKRKAGGRVQDIQFSPNAQYIALGIAACIEVYTCVPCIHPKTKEQVPAWTKLGVCKGHSSLVSAFDWNIDSRLIQCSSSSYELLFFDVPTCERLVGEFLADQVWYTQTCPIGWSVQGVWPRYADGSDINCIAKSRSEQWVITGDDWSQMKMFNYPCIGSGTNRRTGQVDIKPDHKLFTGHASHVTGCVWSFDDSYVCTLGGRDMSILVWKVKYNNVQRREHILDAELIRQRLANQDDSAHLNTSLTCYMCNYEYQDDVAQQCPICFATRVPMTRDHKRAWTSLAESRHRLPTSAFAEHAKLQIKLRKELQSRESLPQMSMAQVVYKAPENEASCSESDTDEEEAKAKGPNAYMRRKLAPALGTTRSGTQVVTSNVVPKMKEVIKGKKTSGPDFRDY